MGKRIRRNRKRTNKRTKKGGMKKITPTPTQFKESRLELKRMLKDKAELDRVSSSSSDELSPKTEYLWKRAIPQKGEVGKDTSEIKEYIDRRLNEQKEEYETKIKNLSSIIDELLILSFGNLQKWMEYGQHINWGGNFIQFVATSSYFNKNFKKYMDLIDTTHPEHIREWPLGGLHPDQKDLFLRMFSKLPSVYENISADDFNNSLELKVRE